MLAIITTLEDLSADYFICHLESRGRPFIRLNAELAGDWRINYEVTNTACFSTIDIGYHQADFRDINAVWYRRVFTPSIAGTSVANARFSSGELRHAVDGLIRISPARWVNDPESTVRAELKLLQLAVAKRNGANIPKTLISNDPNRIRNFFQSIPNVISKPIHAGLIREGGSDFAVYTERVSTADIENCDIELMSCPTLFQEELDRDTDYRITVIGNDVFVASINRNPDYVDWRHPDAETRFQRGSAPDAIKSLCSNIMKDLNLRYGAFDFIETKDGIWYFLEINPAGEWAWLEEQLAFPMRKSLENLLYRE